ncbi:MAG TPA: hypothetical protein VHF92_03560 [Geodermatophilus sp.]|nr:hypothetical protein [Geodermatophilus sp.]
MATAPARRCIPVALAVLATAAAIGVAPPAAAAPASDDPPAVDAGRDSTAAALVRIEVRAQTTVVHVDHSTGAVDIRQGSYPVRQGQATGVLSAEGVVATLWRELAVDLGRVAVPAANRLFVEQLGAQLQDGNDSTVATHATDPALDVHLQHCYQQAEDCTVVAEPQYDVVLLTTEPRRLPAQLVNSPSAPTDVALLRVGGSATPTAVLSDTGTVPAEAVLAGFDADPPDDGSTGEWRPAFVPVQVDGSAVTAEAAEDLPGRMDRGLSGAPLLEPATGEVTGLADRDRGTGQVTAVSAAGIRAALDQAGIPVERSPFDLAFARGLDLLGDGQYREAARELEQAGEYFDSAIAEEHAQVAGARADSGGSTSAGEGSGGWPWWVWTLLVVAVVALLSVLLWLRARRGSGGGFSLPGRRPRYVGAHLAVPDRTASSGSPPVPDRDGDPGR